MFRPLLAFLAISLAAPSFSQAQFEATVADATRALAPSLATFGAKAHKTGSFFSRNKVLGLENFYGKYGGLTIGPFSPSHMGESQIEIGSKDIAFRVATGRGVIEAKVPMDKVLPFHPDDVKKIFEWLAARKLNFGEASQFAAFGTDKGDVFLFTREPQAGKPALIMFSVIQGIMMPPSSFFRDADVQAGAVKEAIRKFEGAEHVGTIPRLDLGGKSPRALGIVDA